MSGQREGKSARGGGLPAPRGRWFKLYAERHAPRNWLGGPPGREPLDALPRSLPEGHAVVMVTAADRAFIESSQEWQGFGGALSDDGGYMTTVESFVTVVETPHGAITLRLARDRSVTADASRELFDGSERVETAHEALYSGVEAALQHVLDVDNNAGEARVTTKSNILPSTAEIAPALEALLAEHPSGVAPKDIYETLAKRLKVGNAGLALKTRDQERRLWDIRVQTARQRLVEHGVIAKGEYGKWRLVCASKPVIEFAPDAASVADLLAQPDVSATDREQLILARIGQGQFRAALIARDQGCALCGLGESDLLVASHIKPWRDATNRERLDPNNGLLLCPGSDKLFDRGLMTFGPKGEVTFSPQLSTQGVALACSDAAVLPKEARARASSYLQHHRKSVFRRSS